VWVHFATLSTPRKSVEGYGPGPEKRRGSGGGGTKEENVKSRRSVQTVEESSIINQLSYWTCCGGVNGPMKDVRGRGR